MHGIDEGDALALATRFDCGYAYRGRQALFWNAHFSAREVLDRYLPGAPLRPFDRRGLLQVDGIYEGGQLALIATQFAIERAMTLREARFARSDSAHNRRCGTSFCDRRLGPVRSVFAI